MSFTTDPNDPALCRGIDTAPVSQCDVYLVLSKEEREKGFVRPVRQTYRHKVCNTTTTMSVALAQTYARDPKFYGSTYCCSCQMHKLVSEFVWEGTKEEVGS